MTFFRSTTTTTIRRPRSNFRRQQWQFATGCCVLVLAVMAVQCRSVRHRWPSRGEEVDRREVEYVFEDEKPPQQPPSQTGGGAAGGAGAVPPGEIDPNSELPEEYYGTWTLVRQSGGFSGRAVPYTPGQRLLRLAESDTPSQTVVVSTEDSARGTAVLPREWRIQYLTSTMFGTAGWVLKNPNSITEQLIRYYPASPAEAKEEILTLDDLMYDGFSHAYQRWEE